MIIIENDLTTNTLEVKDTALILNNTIFNTVNFKNNISFDNNISFFNNIILNGLPFIENPNYNQYNITIDSNNQLFYSPILTNNDTIFALEIESIDNQLSINSNNDGNILFYNKVICNSPININNTINSNNQNITLLSPTNCNNFSILGNNTLKSFTFDNNTNFAIIANIITINTINNNDSIFYQPKNGILNFSCPVSLTNLNINTSIENISFLSLNNNTISKNNNYITNIEGNNFITIINPNQININNSNAINIISKEISFNNKDIIFTNQTNMNFVNISCNNATINNFLITGTSINISYIIAQQKKIPETPSINNFQANGNQFIFNNNNLIVGLSFETKNMLPVSPSALKLVINQNGQLFSQSSSSIRFKENIKILEIDKTDFCKNISLILDKTKNIENKIFAKNLKNTIFEDIIRYDDNLEPLMYEEREMLAICFTQLKNINNEIIAMNEELNNFIL
jgi:hypothetical protein